jgi:hypothetical protein
MKKIYFLAVALFLNLALQAQLNLLPSIGIGPVPANADPVCAIPWYLGSFYTSGKQAGDTAADFTIYSLTGDTFNLATELAKGKPILLIAGNYTCPVFRNKIPSINNVISTYSTQVTTVVYYGVEAHPTDTSPYFGYVNVTSANNSAGILYPQPTTYGQRKQVVTDMLNDPAIPLLAPVYIDGPCNNLWEYYGPAPNNSYLIDTNGIIFSKHGWYDKYPDNIICDIDSLLGNPGPCGGTNYNGTFTYTLLSADTIWGPAGNTLAIDVQLANSSANDALVLLRRMVNNMAPGWASSMCADVCYSTTTDTATILIAAGDTQSFHFYFYTNAAGPDSSMARMRFRNVNNANNVFTRDYFGITSPFSAITEAGFPSGRLNVFPNPASSQITVHAPAPITLLEITDVSGKRVLQSTSSTADISLLPDGFYFIRAISANGDPAIGKLVKTTR